MVGEVHDVAGPHHRLRETAVLVQHLIGENDRHRDRDDGLAEILALVPAQEQLLDHHTQDGDREGADDEGNHPLEHRDIARFDVPGLADHLLLQVDGDVGGEQEECAVRHVDRAHQSEDEGEAGGDDEQQAGEREPVEQRDGELTRLVDRCSRRRVGGPRPVREEQDPYDGQCDDQPDQDHRQFPHPPNLCRRESEGTEPQSGNLFGDDVRRRRHGTPSPVDHGSDRAGAPTGPSERRPTVRRRGSERTTSGPRVSPVIGGAEPSLPSGCAPAASSGCCSRGS